MLECHKQRQAQSGCGLVSCPGLSFIWHFFGCLSRARVLRSQPHKTKSSLPAELEQPPKTPTAAAATAGHGTAAVNLSLVGVPMSIHPWVLHTSGKFIGQRPAKISTSAFTDTYLAWAPGKPRMSFTASEDIGLVTLSYLRSDGHARSLSSHTESPAQRYDSSHLARCLDGNKARAPSCTDHIA